MSSNIKLLEVQWRSLQEDIFKSFNSSKTELQDIWNRIGFNRDQQIKRISRIEQLVKELFDDMLDGERTAENQLRKSIEENMTLLSELTKELKESCSMPGDSMTIFEQDNHLSKQVEILRKEKYNRMAKLNELKLQESQLCARVGSPKLNIPSDICPSLNDLKELETQILFLKNEIKKRMNTINEIISKARKFMESLGRKPKNDYEAAILSKKFEENISLSNEGMERILTIQISLEDEVTKVTNEVTTLQKNIEYLYNILDIHSNDRLKLDKNTPLCVSYQILTDKYSELVLLKRDNIKKFIDAIRYELFKFWDEAFLSEEQKKSYSFVYNDAYDDDSLNLHERELERIKHYLSDYETIIELIKKREELFSWMLTFEFNQTDTSRYNNRGCALLKEEKQRNAIKTQLPKIETEIKELLENDNHYNSFKYRGESYLEIMNNQWSDFNYQKEEKKKQRALLRNGDTLNNSICSTSFRINTPTSIKKETPYSVKKNLTVLSSTPSQMKSQWKSPIVSKTTRKSVGKRTVDSIKNRRPSLKNEFGVPDHRKSFELKINKRKSRQYL